jgi:DNA-binding MarR family transcriptional regulator
MELPQLSEREKRILFFLRLWQHEKRYSPSVKEIGDKFGVKRQTIQQVITSLKNKGYIDFSPSKNWRHRTVLFPKGMTFPWCNDVLPEELFDHMVGRVSNG